MKEKLKQKILQVVEEDEEFKQELKRELAEDSSEESLKNRTNGTSRRDFLKKAGLGVASLSAASVIPSASSLKLESSNSFSFNKFSIDSEGDLDLGGASIKNAMAVDAGNINGSWLKPEENTIESIQELVDGSKDSYIRLKPRTVYRGDTRLHLDSTIKDENGETVDSKNIYIDARGAAVDYNGDEMETVLVQQGNLLPSEPGISDDANDDMAGSITVIGGTWVGPGYEKGEPEGAYDQRTAVFRQNPSIDVKLRPGDVMGAEHGILVQWFNGWNEGCEWGVKRGTTYQGSESLGDPINPRYYVRLASSGSNLATSDWVAGQAGRSSGRESEVYLPFTSAANTAELPDGFDTETATLWQDGPSLHGGFILLRGFVPKGNSDTELGIHYKNTTTAVLNRFCRMVFESEGGNQYSRPIWTNTDDMPTFIGEPRIATNARENIKAIDKGGVSYRTTESVVKADSNSPAYFEVEGQTGGGNGYEWLRYVKNGENILGIANSQGSLALHCQPGKKVHAQDRDRDKVPMRALSMETGPEYQARSIRGSFDEHPSNIGNGDVWYITGDGSPEEGFYGKKSGGVVQIV